MKRSRHAQIRECSLSERHQETCFGTIWHYFLRCRRNSALWVPDVPFYGTWPALVIGIDTEYSPESVTTNNVLSYQFFASSPAGDWLGIHYPSRKRRLKLARYIGSVIKIGLKEGFLQEWPSEVILCAHFALADFPAFEDLSNLVRKMDTVRRTFISLQKPIKITCYDENRHARKVQVQIRDSMLLAPNGKASLKDLGDILGIEKLNLDEGQIERMDVLLASNKPLFETYALRDAEICVRYCDKMRELHHALLGMNTIPFTLSSLGVSLLLQTWKKAGYSADEILGKESVTDEHFNGKYAVKSTKWVSIPGVYMWESFVIETYHGGRNEQYLFGAGEVNDWVDWDLCGAYTTAMALLGMPDWSGIYHTRDLDAYQPSALGFARVDFRFPEGTRFPCLPVRTEAGLIYPLEGQSHCCAPEIYLAVKMGASVVIRDGIILPQNSNVKPFADFIKLATKMRKEYPKGSIFELAWKELGNGTYGKTAQGLREKRCYSSRKNTYDRLPPSKITNPFFAAWVTSFVRAVLSEIMASLPDHVAVCNATTDGLLCTATEMEMDECTSGPLCTMFKSGRYIITGKHECVEAKHSIRQPLGMRTRGQVTLQAIEGAMPVLAKAGVKPPMRDKGEQNEWMIDLFLKRNSQTRSTVRYLRSIADICRNGGDLTPVEISRTIRLDYDWKRAPSKVFTAPIRGVEHLAFETTPWRNAAEAIACRSDWADFSKSSNRILRCVEDLHEFESYRTLSQSSLPIRLPRKGGARKLAARQFLRAYVRNLGGLDKNEMTYQEVADVLTSFGVKTKKSDVENAARSNAVCLANCIPRNPDVLEFFGKLQRKFTGFDPDFLLVPDDGVLGDKITLHAQACRKASRSPNTLTNLYQ